MKQRMNRMEGVGRETERLREATGRVVEEEVSNGLGDQTPLR